VSTEEKRALSSTEEPTHEQPSKTRWRLTQGEREIIAQALVEFAEKIPAEWALGYPHAMYEIAGKLNITERIKTYAKRLDRAAADRLPDRSRR
jgi:hypothetical protein